MRKIREASLDKCSGDGTRHGLDRRIKDTLRYLCRCIVEEWRHDHFDCARGGAEVELGGSFGGRSGLGDHGDVDGAGHCVDGEEVVEVKGPGHALGHVADGGGAGHDE